MFLQVNHYPSLPHPSPINPLKKSKHLDQNAKLVGQIYHSSNLLNIPGVPKAHVPGTILFTPFLSIYVLTSSLRCKRHLAIYGSSWPNRITALEPLSSDPESDSDLELGKGKDKYTKKALLMEPSLKRRKTDSVLFASAAKVTQGEYYGQYGKVAKPLSSKFFDPTAAHRYLANRALSRESSALTLGVKRKWEEIEAEAEYSETSLRIMASFAGFPVAKPLPALSAKPSPILFARSAWTTTAFVDEGVKRQRAISQSNLTLENIRAPSALLGSRITHRSTSLTPPLSPTVGQKRKCDSLPEDKHKERVGRTFYMTGKKKMPKGWVLLSSSSEEEEFEVQEDDGKATAADTIEDPSKYIVEAPEPETMSSHLPRMSEAHAQRHDEPCLIHATKVNSSIEAVISKHHSFSQEENIAVISSAKLPSDHSHSVLTPEYEAAPSMPTDNNKSPRTRSQARREATVTEQPASVVSKLESPADSPPGISYSGTTSESSLATEQNDIVNDKPLELVPSEAQVCPLAFALLSKLLIYLSEHCRPASLSDCCCCLQSRWSISSRCEIWYPERTRP